MKHAVVFALGLAAVAPAVPAQAACHGDARSQMLADAGPTIKASSYRAHMVSSHGGTTVVRDMEYVAPDRVHMSSGSRAPEMISIGGQTWMRMGGQWRSMPVAIGSMVASMRDPGNFNELMNKTHTTIGSLGNGTWNGQSAHLYCTTSTFAGVASSSTFYVLPDHYIHHVVSTSANGSTTVDYKDFNAPISIKAPV